MDTVSLIPGQGWWRRLWGRHPLVRRSDQFEALAALMVTVVALFMLPVAGAVGTAVHDSENSQLAHQLATWHQVSAVVTADSTNVAEPYSAAFLTPLRWTVGSDTHTEAIRTNDARKTGDQVTIWVNEKGGHVGAPMQPAQVAADAIMAAVTVWCAMAGAGAAVLWVLRRCLDRSRYARWDHDFEDLARNGGKRTKPHWHDR